MYVLTQLRDSNFELYLILSMSVCVCVCVCVRVRACVTAWTSDAHNLHTDASAHQRPRTRLLLRQSKELHQTYLFLKR